jgi:hypothetical protein
VLGHVEDILEGLDMESQCFTLSVANIGAASASGIGISVTGFSIDIAAFLALLSSALEMPVRQDLVLTGHLGSREGDILPVENLAAKCEAASSDPDVCQFVYPNLESDLSFKQLKAAEYERASAAIRGCRGRLQLHEVTTTLDLLQKAIEPRAIALASMCSGFFAMARSHRPGTALANLTAYLTRHNDKRFWDGLEADLLAEDFAAGRALVASFIEYHNGRRRYPRAFGAKLSRLVISLPPHLQRSPRASTLVPMEKFIRLIQHASREDEEDV